MIKTFITKSPFQNEFYESFNLSDFENSNEIGEEQISE
jgi:hypothetical protein